MNFIAIDFETANAKRNSACEIGLVKVENFKIVETKAFLIRPKENYFEPFNSRLHGIDAIKVQNEPEFDVIYEHLKEDFENYSVLAHNASFDMSVLRNSLDTYNIPYPKTSYACTVQMARQCLQGQPSYRLNALCDYYNIKLDHHRALSDSIGCAQIAINLFKAVGVEDFSQIEEKMNIRVGKLFQGGYHPSSKKRMKLTDLKFDQSNFQPNNPLYRKNIVFTGTLRSMVRQDAQIKVLEIGGRCANSINKSTDYLIIGDRDYSKYRQGHRSAKMKKVENYIASGRPIKLLTENEFLAMINKS